jgi:uncharacterized membrane protein
MSISPTLIFAVGAGVVGGMVDSGRGFLIGLALGALWGSIHKLSTRLDMLEGAFRDLTARLDALDAFSARSVQSPAAPGPAAPPPLSEQPPPVPPQPGAPPAPPLPAIAQGGGLPSSRTLDELRAADRAAAARATAAAEPGALGAAAAALVEFCTTGNVVAKLGVVILFFGVAFLVRFAAEAGLLPIEYRLMGVTLAAIVMLALGWRLRRSRPDFAMVVQGGAIGILYLTIFAAFRLYELLPPPAALALMLAVVGLSGALAVLQNQVTLAVLGTTGGFLAPILASTGSGSHVSLFSYYLMLNLGIVGLAWFRAWRILNWLGFVFTFGVGLFWGSRFYQPGLFATTEPFLVVFFLFYVAVSVLFARRQPAELRGYIDGSLVFGLPAVAFAMQSELVSEIPLGRAWSAAALSLFYVVLARALWGADHKQRPLAEAFLALGVVFLSLAVPLAFDGPAIAAAWALEGAALVWVGSRQDRILARTAGSLLLVGAGMAFFVRAPVSTSAPAVLNSRFLAGTAIAGGALFAAHRYFTSRASRLSWEAAVEPVLLAWGLVWWTGTLAVEVDRFAAAARELAIFTVGLSLSALAIGAAARRLQWPALAWSAIPFLPMAGSILFVAYFTVNDAGPWVNLGWLSWPLALAASYAVLWWLETAWPSAVLHSWHAATGWMLVFLATWAAAVAVGRLVPDARVWQSVMWAAVPSAAVLLLIFHGHRLAWPVRRLPGVYNTAVPSAPIAAALMWCFAALADSGEPAPLPYVPVLNPLELTQGASILTALHWSRRVWTDDLSGRWAPGAGWFAAAIAFLALNAVVGRIVHTWFGVVYDFEELARSPVFQACISVLWAGTSLSLMTFASRRAARTLWMVGAALLGVLILKLFVIDLGTIGTVARIVSFLVTGLLIMAIGYLSPAPPRQQST